MKTSSQKLQRIAAVFAIITAPITALAVNGPTVSTWIPGAEIVETVAPLSTSLQPGPYNSRDVYKVFVTAVAGKDLRLVVTGSTGVKVDYFDEQRTNGLYAVFGAVDEGTMTLSFQTAPTGTTTWTTNETKVLTVGPKRTMNHDTEVPICTAYDTKAGAAGAGNPTAAQIEARLDPDFINLKADGFNCVQIVWVAAWNNSKSTIYSNFTQHGMKVRQNLYAGQAFMEANMNYVPTGNPWVWRHHNVPLLGLETAVNTDLLADVGGGVALKNHPQLFSYYLKDECPYNFLRGNELMAMLAKHLDPYHGSGASSGGLHGSATSLNIQQMAFSDFLVVNSYPFANADTPYCEGCPATATSDFSKSNWQPGQYGDTPITNFMDWAQSFDPRRPLEVFNQTHTFPNGLRYPSPKELRALVMIAASQGSRPFNYFLYGWFGNLTGFLKPGFVRTPQLDEARLINAKLATWIPTYKDLKTSSTGSTPITYSFATKTPIVGNFVHKTTGDRYLIVANTDTVSAKTVTVNGILNKTGTANATTVKDILSPFTVYNLVNGTLSITVPAGDGTLLRVDPPTLRAPLLHPPHPWPR